LVLLINVTVGIIYSWEDEGLQGANHLIGLFVFLFAKEIFLLTSWKIYKEVILKGGKE
jgi:hypothetical protein